MTTTPIHILPFTYVSDETFEDMKGRALRIKVGTTFHVPESRLLYLEEEAPDVIYENHPDGVIRYRRRLQ